MNLEHRNNCILFCFTPAMKQGDWFGFFDEDVDKVFVYQKLSLLERECTYFHEMGHRTCFLNKCKCSENPMQQEYHALKYEFLKVLARKSQILNRVYLKLIRDSFLKYGNNVVWRLHLTALRRLKKLKMFEVFERENKC